MSKSIVLQEWKTREPGPAPDPLADLSFDDPAILHAAQSLRAGNRLRVHERRRGIAIEARAHVGIVQVGPVRVTVSPKIATEDLWYILAYGLGLDVVDRRFPVEILVPDAPFADVLALLLLEEANTLLRRGIQRGYRAREGWLASPRGRLDVRELAAAWPLTRAALPCHWHELSSDTLDNRVVRAGLQLAKQVAHTTELRAAIGQAERAWEGRCGPLRLDAATLARVHRERTRLTAAYEHAHCLVALLWSGAGMPDDLAALGAGDTPIPGFLWNMATLFERFVTRFLRDHLPPGTLRAQDTLSHLFAKVKGPAHHPVPRPRPDFVLRRAGRVVAVLDAKYRDLHDHRLTREMLYQLSLYGVAFGPAESGPPVPVIALYPREPPLPDEIVYELCLPAGGRIPIRLRAVAWVEASRTVRSTEGRDRARKLAEEWTRLS